MVVMEYVFATTFQEDVTIVQNLSQHLEKM
jgi:hypothetical protein